MQVSRLYPLLAASLLAVVVARAAIPPGDRTALEAAIVEAVNHERSGVTVDWNGSTGRSATIVVGKAYSRASGQICDSCNDPCRTVDYQVTAPDAITDFHGERCLMVDGTGSAVWKRQSADTVVRNRTIQTPPPDKTNNSRRRAMVAQKALLQLRYYTGAVDGDFGEASRSALADFLADERSSLEPQPSKDVLALLAAAEQRITHTTCPRVDGATPTQKIACGTVSG